MSRAVRFDRYGGIDVLNVVDVKPPVPGPSQVVVRVKAAGINPGEAKIREGLMHSRFPATFPSTIVDFQAAQTHGVKTEGSAAGARAEVLAELAALIDQGRLEVPIAAVYPLEQVRDAFAALEQQHIRGKIVLRP